MSSLINNKVAESGLITIDLSTYLPNNEIVCFDIKPFLFMELIIKEKDFRAALSALDWTIYQSKIVGIFCSADAIIPMWANMLIVASLKPFATAVFFGNEEKAKEQVLLQQIQQINAEEYINQRVVIKGCGDNFINESAYVAITEKLCPVVKSIMYGEPCSTVPVYKRKTT